MFRILFIGDSNTYKCMQNAIDSINKAEIIDARVFYYDSIEKIIKNVSDVHYDLLFIDVHNIDLDIFKNDMFLMSTIHFDCSILISEQKLCPIEYTLLKPIGFVKQISSKETIDVIKTYISTARIEFKLFEFNSNRKKYVILKHEILFFQSDKNKIFIYTEKDVYSFYGKLSDLSQMVTFKDFLQVHKSYLINPYHIKTATLHYVIVGKYNIPISRSKIHIIDKWLKG